MKFYRHNKTKGVYNLLGECRIEETDTLAVMYQDIINEVIWVRPKEEFFDGRFSKIKAVEIIK
jgi:hypothetical protein